MPQTEMSQLAQLLHQAGLVSETILAVEREKNRAQWLIPGQVPALPPDATAKQILAMLEDWAQRAHGTQINYLWNVLTALRGPDDPGMDKENTTCIIRRAAVPHLASNAGACISSSYPPDGIAKVLKQLTELKYDERTSLHFNRHISKAAYALLAEDS